RPPRGAGRAGPAGRGSGVAGGRGGCRGLPGQGGVELDPAAVAVDELPAQGAAQDQGQEADQAEDDGADRGGGDVQVAAAQDGVGQEQAAGDELDAHVEDGDPPGAGAVLDQQEVGEPGGHGQGGDDQGDHDQGEGAAHERVAVLGQVGEDVEDEAGRVQGDREVHQHGMQGAASAALQQVGHLASGIDGVGP